MRSIESIVLEIEKTGTTVVTLQKEAGWIAKAIRAAQ